MPQSRSEEIKKLVSTYCTLVSKHSHVWDGHWYIELDYGCDGQLKYVASHYGYSYGDVHKDFKTLKSAEGHLIKHLKKAIEQQKDRQKK